MERFKREIQLVKEKTKRISEIKKAKGKKRHEERQLTWSPSHRALFFLFFLFLPFYFQIMFFLSIVINPALSIKESIMNKIK